MTTTTLQSGSTALQGNFTVETTTPTASPRIPTEGDKVLYVLGEGQSKGEIRAAFVTRNWNITKAGDVNLQVLTDNTNDFHTSQKGADGTLWRTSVPYSENKEPGTWHWPTEQA